MQVQLLIMTAWEREDGGGGEHRHTQWSDHFQLPTVCVRLYSHLQQNSVIPENPKSPTTGKQTAHLSGASGTANPI